MSSGGNINSQSGGTSLQDGTVSSSKMEKYYDVEKVEKSNNR